MANAGISAGYGICRRSTSPRCIRWFGRTPIGAGIWKSSYLHYTVIDFLTSESVRVSSSRCTRDTCVSSCHSAWFQSLDLWKSNHNHFKPSFLSFSPKKLGFFITVPDFLGEFHSLCIRKSSSLGQGLHWQFEHFSDEFDYGHFAVERRCGHCNQIFRFCFSNHSKILGSISDGSANDSIQCGTSRNRFSTGDESSQPPIADALRDLSRLVV